MALVSEIGRRTSAVSLEPRSTSFRRQRISAAVQRRNVSCDGTLLTLLNNSYLKEYIWRRNKNKNKNNNKSYLTDETGIAAICVNRFIVVF